MTRTKTQSLRVLWLPLGAALRIIAGLDQDPDLNRHKGLEAPAHSLEDVGTGALETAAPAPDSLLGPTETTIHMEIKIEVVTKIAADLDTDLRIHQAD